MQTLSYDLHIHSCLSPCGDDDSSPANIVGMAYVKGLDVIALCDHNTAKNCPAALKVAEQYGVTLICGMELTTAEEVHVICLFDTLDKALAFDELVYGRLLPVQNEPEIFGNQLIKDEDDNTVGEVEKLLINATSIGFSETFALVGDYGGVAIPAHIDKQANSMLSNLGFVPPDSTFKTVELKNTANLSELRRLHPYLNECRVITDSDAHYLEHINEPKNYLHAEEKTARAVIEALKKQQI